MIQGGWEFVWSAYGIAYTALIAYGVSLYTRTRGAQKAAHAVDKPEMRA